MVVTKGGEKMRKTVPTLLVDILHYPHLNFYKNAIKILKEKGIEIKVVVRPRGNLISIFQKEFPDTSFDILGQHRKSISGKIFDLFTRDLALLKYIKKNHCDIGTAVGSINLAHANFFLKKPSIIFSDDLEYKLVTNLVKPFATHLVIPACSVSNGQNLLKYKGFKELAYLHPNYFHPNKRVLEPYNIEPNEYVFIREVSNSSLNYKNLEMGRLSKLLEYLEEMELKILLSIEDKSLVNLFEDKCIILKEPVEDIHSLLHYANLTISSGDSMARESCLVGTPAIYTGGREMAVNSELIKRSLMFKQNNGQQIENKIKYLIDKDVKKDVGIRVKKLIKNEWSDTTQVIIDILMGSFLPDYSLIEKYK
jgi:predicted glycosyltransferase